LESDRRKKGKKKKNHNQKRGRSYLVDPSRGEISFKSLGLLKVYESQATSGLIGGHQSELWGPKEREKKLPKKNQVEKGKPQQEKSRRVRGKSDMGPIGQIT